MNKQTFAFNGVFIPANVWTHPQLSWLDKFVWAVVANMHDGSQICNATDAEIGDMLHENEMLVTTSVNNLISFGLINAGTGAEGQRQLWRVWVEFVEKEAKADEAQASTADVQRIIDLYNEICKSMPRAEKITPGRLIRIRRLLKTMDETLFKALFFHAHASDFLSGRNGKWSGCNIDWILAPANIDRIKEGIYDNRKVAPAPRQLPTNLR